LNAVEIEGAIWIFPEQPFDPATFGYTRPTFRPVRLFCHRLTILVAVDPARERG
jgi:hypothetical protein